MFTLIGDLIGSRRIKDRAAAQRTIGAVLDRVNEAIDTAQAMEPTVGDEIQGGFATIGDAALATLLIRLELAPELEMRFGLGRGDVTVHDNSRHPLLQDGPGWWTARKAVDELKDKRGTLYLGPDDNSQRPDPDMVNAFLTARDALVMTLNDRQHRMLLLALRGKSQREIAEHEGITESAVSQAFARGVRAAHDAQILFGKAG